MDIKEKITKQSDAGFSDSEIYANLLADGHSKEEIDQEWKVASKEVQEKNSISSKGIIFGFLFLIVVVFRIARFSNSSGGGSSVLLFISIITGVILMIYWFTRTKR